MANDNVVDFALRRMAIRLWGNTAHARKWLAAVRYLDRDWVLLRVDRERLRHQVRLLEESKLRERELWSAKVRRIK